MTDRTSPPDESEAQESEPEEFFPQFSTVRRGYDPDEVEQVLDELYASLSDAVRDAEEKSRALYVAQQARQQAEEALGQARHRVAELERRPADEASTSFETLGSRIADILNSATAEAAEITRAARDEAQADAERILAEARQLRDAQHRADVEVYERVAAEMAQRHGRAEGGFAEEAAAHQRRLAALTARMDEMTEGLAQARDRAAAQAETILTQARTQAEAVGAEAEQHRSAALEARAQVRAQLADVRRRLDQAASGPESVGSPVGASGGHRAD